MATIHYVQLQQMPINPLTGNVVVRSTAKIRDMLQTNLEWRVIEKVSVPNSAGNPTVDAYLALEAADGLLVGHMDVSNIVTQKA